MTDDIPGTRTHLARCISAEFRARMAAQRISGKALSAMAGMSQNYLAKRLRDEAPFTLDDVEVLVEHVDVNFDPPRFIAEAIERNSDEVWAAMDSQRLSRPLDRAGASAPPEIEVLDDAVELKSRARQKRHD